MRRPQFPNFDNRKHGECEELSSARMHQRLHLAWRVPALMIGNPADSPSSIRRRCLECGPIHGPSPSVEQHHTGDVGCSIWWLGAAGQCEAAAFWRGDESLVEVQLIECSAYDVEYNQMRSRRKKAFYLVKCWIPAVYNAGDHENE